MATTPVEPMNLEQFKEVFAHDSSRTLETGGTVFYGRTSGRTEVDIMFRKPPEYEEAWGWSDPPYRMVFIDLDGRSTITYCEEDISMTIHETKETFEKELLASREFYNKPRFMDRDYSHDKPGSHKDPEGEALGLIRNPVEECLDIMPTGATSGSW